MVTLPPDFWTKLQPGGLEGIAAGAVIWVYFFGAMYWKARWPSLANFGWLMVLWALLMAGLLLGSVIGVLVE
jgi:hypothetical protein